MDTLQKSGRLNRPLAAVAGALAWTVPFLLFPFLHLLLPFIPHFPETSFPPFSVDLADSTICFALGSMIASAIFLLPLYQYLARPGQPRTARATSRIALAAVLAAGVGGASAALVGLSLGFSLYVRSLFMPPGIFKWGPEPYLSIGMAFGAFVSVIIFLLCSGLRAQETNENKSQAHMAIRLALRILAAVLLCRTFYCVIQFSSFARYTTFGKSVTFWLITLGLTGALFGVRAWGSTARVLHDSGL